MVLGRCQTIAYHDEKRGKAVQGGGPGPGVTLEESAYFAGTHKRAGEVMICPELMVRVSGEIAKNTEVASQLRKAREEARLSRQGDGQSGDAAGGARSPYLQPCTFKSQNAFL